MNHYLQRAWTQAEQELFEESPTRFARWMIIKNHLAQAMGPHREAARPFETHTIRTWGRVLGLDYRRVRAFLEDLAAWFAAFPGDYRIVLAADYASIPGASGDGEGGASGDGEGGASGDGEGGALGDGEGDALGDGEGDEIARKLRVRRLTVEVPKLFHDRDETTRKHGRDRSAPPPGIPEDPPERSPERKPESEPERGPDEAPERKPDGARAHERSRASLSEISERRATSESTRESTSSQVQHEITRREDEISPREEDRAPADTAKPASQLNLEPEIAKLQAHVGGAENSQTLRKLFKDERGRLELARRVSGLVLLEADGGLCPREEAREVWAFAWVTAAARNGKNPPATLAIKLKLQDTPPPRDIFAYAVETVQRRRAEKTREEREKEHAQQRRAQGDRLKRIEAWKAAASPEDLEALREKARAGLPASTLAFCKDAPERLAGLVDTAVSMEIGNLLDGEPDE